MFFIEGWSYGDDDCDPPEPQKRWLTIRDQEYEEICIFVQRRRGDAYRLSDTIRLLKKANLVERALNALAPA